MFRELTVYQVACDACGSPYEVFDPEIGEAFELRIESPDLTMWARSMTEDGWLVGSDVLCPDCAAARTDAVMGRLGVEMTQGALWGDEPCGDPAEDERWWRIGSSDPERGLRGRRIETVPISIDDWPLEG